MLCVLIKISIYFYLFFIYFFSRYFVRLARPDENQLHGCGLFSRGTPNWIDLSPFSSVTGSNRAEPAYAFASPASISVCKRIMIDIEVKREREGERGWLSSRVLHSWAKGRGFESRQEWRENVLLQGRLSVLTDYRIRSTPVLPQQHVKDPGHSAKSAGGRLHSAIAT